MKRLALCFLFGLAACVSDAPAASISMGPAPLAPAYLKDLPGEMKNGLAVNYTQANVGSAIAPDLFPLRIPTQSWLENWTRLDRPHIQYMLQDNQYGLAPEQDTRYTATVAHTYSERGTAAFGGKALRSQSTITLTTSLGSHTLDVLLYTPAGAEAPSPVVLMVNFSPSVAMVDDPGVKETDGWTAAGERVPGRSARAIAKQDIMPFLARGYGVAMVYYSQIEPDFLGGSAFGLRAIYGKVDEATRGPQYGGAIATWAAGSSLVRQHLAMDPAVDGKRIALYGISRLGKAVLWAGANDAEFAAVIAVCSGEGGGALSRRNYGETIGHVAANFPYWFAPRWNGFAADPSSSPVDAHMVLALIAPRPLLLITGETDAWSDPYGEFLAARLATPVYQLYGKHGVDATPALDTPTGGTLTYMIHTGGHGPAPADTPAILDFLDRQLSNQVHM